MTTILAVLFLAMGISVIATLLMMRLSVGLNVMDRPDETRHLHGRPTPKLGGVAVFLAFAIPVMLLMHLQEITLTSNLILRDVVKISGLLVGGFVMLVVGLIDDIYDLRPRWKILLQLICVTIAYKAGFRIDALSFPFLGAVQLGDLSYLFTAAWFLMCINAVNLLDGHDGLAAGACLFVGFTLMLVSLNSHQVLGALLMAAFAGSILGFLLFNFPPAKIFLGDSGSLVLGFLVAGLSLVGATMKAETAFALLVPIVAMGLPFFDVLFAIMRRMYSRMPMSTGDRGHIHHLLQNMGYSSRRVVLSLYGVTVALCALAFVITVMRNEVALLIVIGLMVTGFVAVRVFSGITPGAFLRELAGGRSARSRIVKVRLAFQSRVEEIRNARSESDVWAICGEALVASGVKSAKLSVEQSGAPREMYWPSESRPDESAWSLRVPLAEKGVAGFMLLEFPAADHGLVALPEFMGLIEKISAVLGDSMKPVPCDSSKEE